MSLSNLKILSSNVNGFGNSSKRREFFTHFEKSQPDILCLVDTRLCSKTERGLMNEIEYNCTFNSFSSNQRGVAVLINKKSCISTNILHKDAHGNCLILKCSYADKSFSFMLSIWTQRG